MRLVIVGAVVVFLLWIVARMFRRPAIIQQPPSNTMMGGGGGGNYGPRPTPASRWLSSATRLSTTAGLWAAASRLWLWPSPAPAWRRIHERHAGRARRGDRREHPVRPVRPSPPGRGIPRATWSPLTQTRRPLAASGGGLATGRDL